MSTTEARRTLIEQVWAAAWGQGDVDALDQLLSPDYRRHSAEGDPQDLSAFKTSVLATRSAFPDLVTTIDDIVVDGDRAAIRWHSNGTHENSLLGVPATQRRVEVGGATFARFEGDTVAEEFVTWDPRALLSALGIIRVGQD
ncbi:hypothetical protein C3486_05165 [Streptomyces sp. Ru73]|uniref:ester cyclase n=1 Tax=Streptomyces sp. Ru73 TaxID=2080748 RepID=UPI000CDDD382|nr:ester cyclase [Streptomyces sp. Ru73]POX42399.1 hypothetical protein C3486_05165 [Streptomyces sp. Ru73]